MLPPSSPRGLLPFILCPITVFGLLQVSSVFAQTFPNKPVRIVVPFSAGSGGDVFARTLGPKFTETWGQQIIVENREGAGGRTRAVNRGPACGM